MQYFFVLGNNPTLSAAELQAVLGKADCQLVNQQLLVADLEAKIDASELIARLGGTIKIGVVREVVNDQFPKILAGVGKIISERDWQGFSGKFKFGFSTYGAKLNLKSLAMETKKLLKDKNISCRWVTSKEPVLSSVVVEQNKLTSQGLEVVCFLLNKKIYLGQTLAVQPFKALSARDYGRPARDDQSGMLPPKLAQIMINLAQAKKSEVLLDPFCGSGTVLSEALLMGFDKVLGADLSARAIADTKKNLEWIKKQFNPRGEYELYQSDARKITQKIKHQVGVIVTEPYLGPQRGQVNVRQTAAELSLLYSQALAELKKIISSHGYVVMAWPIWQKDKGLEIKLQDWKIIPPLNNDLLNQGLKLTERNTIIYGRPQQKVWRELVILQKK